MSLNACNRVALGDPQLTGRVVATEGSRILVVGGITREEAGESVESILSSGKFKEVYWVKVRNSKRYKAGDQVKVWFHVSNDSYPAQTEADKIIMYEKLADYDLKVQQTKEHLQQKIGMNTHLSSEKDDTLSASLAGVVFSYFNSFSKEGIGCIL
ncbi:hypothetical protein B1A99_09595 [Cohnella sp. CIP 111063]|nr:hypothetical protein B1A99_09595 [Cohnella sp. CIP 111063]